METTIRPTLALLLAVILSACKAPTVNLSTNEPIKVDINMRLDVYQYAANQKAGSGAASKSADAEAESRHINRQADIQTFKNSGYVGESHEGLLVVRSLPEGEYADYVRKVTDAENADRLRLMNSLAEQQKVSLPAIQKQQAEIWVNRSFKNEWIEVARPDGTWMWVQKEG